MKISIFWDWLDFGFILHMYRTGKWTQYAVALDIQILWFNIWIQFWERKEYRKRCNIKK